MVVQRPHSSAMRIGLTVVAGLIVVPIDFTIVTVALARLSQELGASLPVIQWVSTGYALGLAVLLPAAAWAVAKFGARHVFLAAIAVFRLFTIEGVVRA